MLYLFSYLTFSAALLQQQGGDALALQQAQIAQQVALQLGQGVHQQHADLTGYGYPQPTATPHLNFQHSANGWFLQ